MKLNPKVNVTVQGSLLVLLGAIQALEADPNWKLIGVLVIGAMMVLVSLISQPVGK